MTYNLRTELEALAKSANDITKRAEQENRDITADELKEHKQIVVKAEALKERIARIDAGQKALADLAGTGEKSGNRYLALTGVAAKAAGQNMRDAIVGHLEEYAGGLKAGLLQPGAVTTQVPLTDTDPTELKRIPTSLLELIRVKERTTPTWRGIRQVSRENNASIVPAGATKPTSKTSIGPTDGYLSVIAHMSEPVDKYLLLDNSNLATFITRDLLWGLSQELEAELYNGDGTEFELDGVTGRHFTGIMHATGVQQQAYVDDKVTTLRATATTLEVLGYAADAYVLNPRDWQAIETARNASGNFDLGSVVNRAERKLWSTQVVTSAQVSAGQALAIDLDSLNVDTDTNGIETRWTDQGPELFDKNLLKARTEGRFGVSIEQPQGIAVVDLTAA